MAALVLTDEQARGYAQRWAKWRTCVDRLGKDSALARSYRLSGPKREALFAWVRLWRAGPDRLAQTLALTTDQAKTLLVAAHDGSPS